MNKKLNLFWNNLEQKAKKYKISKNQKEKTFSNFLTKIKNAKKSVYLFGLNFPNYMTNSNDKIFMALKYLDKNNPSVKVRVFIPNLKIKNYIETISIYPHKYNTLRRDWNKLQDFTNDFKNLNIKVITYNKFINFGFSVIDIEDNKNSFIHISKVIKNQNIKDAEFYNIEKDKSVNYLIKKIVKDMEK